MTTRDELDALSSRELHDLAVRRALHHVDVEFLWNLLRAIPAAEASEGHDAEAGRDITKVTALIGDAIDSGEGDVAEALRPLYIDYLAKHGTGSLAGARPTGLVRSRLRTPPWPAEGQTTAADADAGGKGAWVHGPRPVQHKNQA